MNEYSLCAILVLVVVVIEQFYMVERVITLLLLKHVIKMFQRLQVCFFLW